MNLPFTLSDKTALVTGANRGIGEAIVHALLTAGAHKIYAAVRDASSAAHLVEAGQGRVESVPLDLTVEDSVNAAAQRAKDVEIVINNGGVLTATDPLAPDAFEALDHEFDVNVRGLLRIARAFAPVLQANGGGALVQINSVASLACYAPLATYCASKAAAFSITQGLRDRLRGQGTRVLSVLPGPIATEMANQAGVAEQAEPPAVVAEALIEALKKGQAYCFPDAIAQAFGRPYADFIAALTEAGYLNP